MRSLEMSFNGGGSKNVPVGSQMSRPEGKWREFSIALLVCFLCFVTGEEALTTQHRKPSADVCLDVTSRKWRPAIHETRTATLKAEAQTSLFMLCGVNNKSQFIKDGIYCREKYETN